MKLFTRRIGIDLGTSNTLVFVPGIGVIVEEPTIVAVNESENKIIAVGNKAKEMLGKTPMNILAYRPMKDGVVADSRVTEAMLRYFVSKAMGGWSLFRPVLVISVPAGVTQAERRAVVEAAERAGARRAYVVKEPLLAALGAGIDIMTPVGRMIIDIGGGTTDVAVISMGGIVCSVSVKCAGNKIDQAIIDYVKKMHHMIIGEQTAEEVKVNIGSAIVVAAEEELSMKIQGRDMRSGVPTSCVLRTNDVVRAIEGELKIIVKAVRKVLEQTPPELASDILDKGIVMSGGTSQLRNFTKLIERKTGSVRTSLAPHAFYCVARGTGWIIEHFDEYERALVSKYRVYEK